MKSFNALLVLVLLLTPALVAQSQSAGWHTWRGNDTTGVAPKSNPPTEWSEDKNVRWKIRIPGDGASTPVIVKDRIYVMSAVKTDRDGKPTAGKRPTSGRSGRSGRRGGRRGGRGMRGSRAPTKVWEFVVVALDRKTGKEIWKKKVHEEVPHESGHRTGSQASNSPVTDGEHIYAFFGSRGVHCLDLDGEVKWSVDLGSLFTRNQFGEGSSPALHGDTLVVNWDHEGDSFIVALNKKTGKERWRKERRESTSWGTPTVAVVKGRPQVIITATRASKAYDLKSGKELWSCGGMTANCIPTPIVKDGIAYLMSGFRGFSLQAINLAAAKGDITDTKAVKWSHGRNTSYVPSALLYGDTLYFLRSNNAVLSCLDAKSGKVHYEGQRLDGLRTVYSSPVGAGGRVYITSRDGATKVFAHGSEYKELASNKLDDTFDGSAAIVGNEIFLRGRKYLYCIGSKTTN